MARVLQYTGHMRTAYEAVRARLGGHAVAQTRHEVTSAQHEVMDMASDRLLSDAAIDCLLGWAFGGVRGPGWLETPAQAGDFERHAVDVDGPALCLGWLRADGVDPRGCTCTLAMELRSEGEG